MTANPLGFALSPRSAPLLGPPQLCRWRNDGLAPVFAPPRPATLATSLLVVSPDGEIASEGRTTSLDPAALDNVSDPAKRLAWARDMLRSVSPSHRVEGLEVAGLLDTDGTGSPALRAKGQAAMLLGYLERVGEPYGPPEVRLFVHSQFSDETDLTDGAVLACRTHGLVCGVFFAAVEQVLWCRILLMCSGGPWG